MAVLAGDVESRVDARAERFPRPDDPRFTGWHRLERLLFKLRTTAGAGRFADRLDADLAALARDLRATPFPPAAVADGAARLLEGVARGTLVGTEDRYARTDLWDADAAVDGARKLIEVLGPPLEASEPKLVDKLAAGFAGIGRGLDEYAVAGGGFRPSTALTSGDRARLQAQLASQTELLTRVPGALGLA